MEIQAEVKQSATYKFTFDESSPEFKEALESYNEVIGEGDIEDMIRHVGFYISKFESIKKMVEGVGCLAPVDGKSFGDDWSGIFVEVIYEDDWDVDLRIIEPQTVS